MNIPMRRNSKINGPTGFAAGAVVGAVVAAFAIADQMTTPPSFEVAGVVSVYDGDTFRVDFKCSEAIVCTDMPIRVRGVDTPEIKGRCPSEREKAIAARDFTRSMLEGGTVTLSDLERGKYFRIVADVEVGGHNLARELIDAGHGRTYDGGKRAGWCEG